MQSTQPNLERLHCMTNARRESENNEDSIKIAVHVHANGRARTHAYVSICIHMCIYI